MEKVSQTSASLTAGLASLAASPARNLSALVKEPGPGAFRTSNTASASASLTSAMRARSAGSSGRSRPQSRQSVCSSCPSASANPGPPPTSPSRPRLPRSGEARSQRPAYLRLPSPWAQCILARRSGISRATSSPASSSLTHLERLPAVGNIGSVLAAFLAESPLRWNSQRIPSFSSLVYIPDSNPGPHGPTFCPGSRSHEFVTIATFDS